MSVEAKTVLLSECKGVLRIKREDECSFSDEVLTGYIEAEPLLDLLERAYSALSQITHWSGSGPHPVATPWAEDAEPLLRTHGRLK